MTDEMRVSIEPDHGIKNQWAKGLFYREDGKKKTLAPRTLLIASSIVFIGISIVLLIQGGPEDLRPQMRSSSYRNASISVPADIPSQIVENIPAVGGGVISNTFKSQTIATNNNGMKSNNRKDKFSGPQFLNRPRTVKIPPGSFVKATLLSGASNGPVRAEVIEGLSINGENLIEEGSILVGMGQSGQDRLNIRFSQMISKDGAFETITAQACDADDKIPGLKGSMVGNHALKLAAGIGLNFVGGLTAALQDTHGEYGAVITRPTLKNALLNGAATASLDQSRETMSDLRNRTPVIEVPAGTPIYVFMQGD